MAGNVVGNGEGGRGGEKGRKRRPRKRGKCKKSEAKESKNLPYSKNHRVGLVHAADQKTKISEPNGKKHRPNLIYFSLLCECNVDLCCSNMYSYRARFKALLATLML